MRLLPKIQLGRMLGATFDLRGELLALSILRCRCSGMNLKACGNCPCGVLQRVMLSRVLTQISRSRERPSKDAVIRLDGRYFRRSPPRLFSRRKHSLAWLRSRRRGVQSILNPTESLGRLGAVCQRGERSLSSRSWSRRSRWTAGPPCSRQRIAQRLRWSALDHRWLRT
jgi:hypothetical protein